MIPDLYSQSALYVDFVVRTRDVLTGVTYCLYSYFLLLLLLSFIITNHCYICQISILHSYILIFIHKYRYYFWSVDRLRSRSTQKMGGNSQNIRKKGEWYHYVLITYLSAIFTWRDAKFCPVLIYFIASVD